MARGVSGALALTLLPADRSRLAIARPVNPAAYEAYLIGRSHERRLSQQELDRALNTYETAVKLDPDFALAHFGIGAAWGARVQVGLVSRAEGAGRADAALQKALALDDSLPEGHMAMGNRATWQQWDWSGAESSFRHALDLNPSLAEAHMFYSHYLYMMRRPQEGAAEIQRALDLDPLNDLVQQFYGMTLRFERRFEEAIDPCAAGAQDESEFAERLELTCGESPTSSESTTSQWRRRRAPSAPGAIPLSSMS